MIYLVVGVPAAGKSWVCEQLQDRMRYVHHDLYVGSAGPAYFAALREAVAACGHRPVLGECPFSLSTMLTALDGLVVEPVFIVEDPEALRERYLLRERGPMPDSRLKQQETYRQRAEASGAFCGTSAEVLAYLFRRCP